MPESVEFLDEEVFSCFKNNKTKVKSVQLGKPCTEPRVLRKCCVVVGGGWWRFQRLYGEVPEIIWCVNLL